MDNEPKEPKYIEIEIPRCCREGDESCPHVTNKPQPKQRQNPV